jgi:transcriptional regulator with XRE-family HTH domain
MARTTPSRTSEEKRTIGAAVRRARTARGLTMVQLAESVGVTQPFISQVESGRAAPSMTTLYRLAEALAVPTAALLPPAAGTSPSRAALVRAGGGTTVPFGSGEHELLAHHLGRGGDSLVFPMLFELPVGYSDPKVDPDPYRHEGEAFLYLLRGTLEIEVDAETFRLEAGDSLHHDTSVTHRWTVLGDVPALLLDVEATFGQEPFTPM